MANIDYVYLAGGETRKTCFEYSVEENKVSLPFYHFYKFQS